MILFRGINVGGKNKIPMGELKEMLQELGFTGVKSYIASGNVILRSAMDRRETAALIENRLPLRFSLDRDLVRVLVLSRTFYLSLIENSPSRFGENREIYLYDVIFLMDIPSQIALQSFKPREGVDKLWTGEGVIYSRRLGAERTKSGLNKVIGTKVYQNMTIRNWNTAVKIAEMLGEE